MHSHSMLERGNGWEELTDEYQMLTDRHKPISHHFESCCDFLFCCPEFCISSNLSGLVLYICNMNMLGSNCSLSSLFLCCSSVLSQPPLLSCSAKPATVVCIWPTLTLHFCLVPYPEPRLSPNLFKNHEPSKCPALCTPCVVYHKTKVD